MFEELEASLSLDAGDFIRDANRAAEASDEVGDSVEEAGDDAAGAAAGFTALRLSTSGASFSLGMLTSVGSSTIFMLGALATAITGVVIALSPLIIGATAIAAAFGLIIGSGILAWGKGFQKALKDVRKQIVPLVKEFGKEFVPFLRSTIKMLPGLVKSILDAIGPLDKFETALRTLRNIAFRVLPKLIGWFIDIGRWALPIVMKLSKILLNNLVPALKTIVGWGKQIWRTVRDWVTQLQKATQKGTTLRKKFNQLKKAGQKLWTKALKPLIKNLKPLVRQLIKLAPTIAKVALDVGKLALNIGTKLLPYLTPLINIATKLVKWFNSLSYGVKRLILVAGGLYLALGPIISVLGFLGSALTTVGSIILTVVTFFNPIVLAVVAFGATIGALAYLIYDNWNKILSWTKGLYNGFVGWLEDMASAASRLGQSIANGLIKAYNALMPDSLGIPSITLPRVGFEVPGLTLGGHVIYEATSVGVGPFGPFGGNSVSIPQLDTGGFIENDGLAMLHAGERVLNPAQVDRRDGDGNRGPMEVIVTLDTDDEALKQWVDERADVQVKDHVNGALKAAKRRGTIQ